METLTDTDRPWKKWHRNNTILLCSEDVDLWSMNTEDVNGQSTDQTMQSSVMLLCVLDGAVMRWRSVADWPSSDRSCDNYRPVNSVWAVEQCTRETCIGAGYRSISGRRDNCKVADFTINIAISPIRYEP